MSIVFDFIGSKKWLLLFILTSQSGFVKNFIWSHLRSLAVTFLEYRELVF